MRRCVWVVPYFTAVHKLHTCDKAVKQVWCRTWPCNVHTCVYSLLSTGTSSCSSVPAVQLYYLVQLILVKVWTTVFTYRKRQNFRGWKSFAVCWVHQVCRETFAILSITIFMHSRFFNSTKLLQYVCFTSFVFLMRSSYWMTLVWADFTLSRMIDHRRRRRAIVEAIKLGSKLEMKWVRDETVANLQKKPTRNQQVNFLLIESLVRHVIFQKFHCNTAATFRGAKLCKENFHGLLKIRENRENFFTVKLLLFTVCYSACILLVWLCIVLAT